MQPPQNPYAGLPGPNDPLPPYGAPGSPMAVPPRGPEISFDAISQAWTVFQSSMGTYIGATVVILLFSAVFQGLQIAATPRNPQESSVLPLFISLLSILVNQLLGAGFLRLAIQHLRTGKADFGEMLSVFDVLPNLILAGILVWIATILGFCACILPGMLLSGLFMFVTPLIVDRRMGAIDAISTSFNTLKPQMWMALIFVIVVGILASVGAFACLVGLLFTIPLSVLSIAITYRNFFDGGNSPPMTGSVMPGPTAPIADPRF